MTPEKLFERRWASALLDQVRQRLQTEYAAQGKTQLYERLRPCLTGAEHLLPYAELAVLLGLSESGVKMAVQRLRRRYGEMLRLAGQIGDGVLLQGGIGGHHLPGLAEVFSDHPSQVRQDHAGDGFDALGLALLL